MSQKACLPVSRRRKREDDGMSFTDIQSMDATAYLSLVVEEASRLPEVVVAKPSSKTEPSNVIGSNGTASNEVIVGSAASLQYLVSHRTAIHPPPSAQHVPVTGHVWVERTLANFSRLRSYLETCQPAKRIAVPPMKDMQAWHIFCVGEDDAYGNPGGYFQDSDNSDSNSADDKLPPPEPAWKANLPAAGHIPGVSLLLQMDQVMIRRVLGHMSHYVSNDGFAATGQRAAWIYALLARLERPIHRDDAVTMYSLLKKLTLLRSRMPPKDAAIGTVNVLIAVIGIYFEQGGGYAQVMEVSEQTS